MNKLENKIEELETRIDEMQKNIDRLTKYYDAKINKRIAWFERKVNLGSIEFYLNYINDDKKQIQQIYIDILSIYQYTDFDWEIYYNEKTNGLFVGYDDEFYKINMTQNQKERIYFETKSVLGKKIC